MSLFARGLRQVGRRHLLLARYNCPRREDMSDVTALLTRWAQGDREAFQGLLPLVYEELRRIAQHHLRRERAGHTLQPTALVHEAYLRLSGLREVQLNNRSHFYGAAAQVMRRVLVDHARKHRALKRGGADTR